MKKLEAAMRDRSAATWKQRKAMYRVGSYFKGCHNCGEVEWVETAGGREVKRYRSGYEVFRAYQPSWTGWTYWCYQCGAKDGRCWEDAIDLGTDAIVGARDAVRAMRAKFRKDHERNDRPARTKDPSREAQIEELTRQIEALEARIRGGK